MWRKPDTEWACPEETSKALWPKHTLTKGSNERIAETNIESTCITMPILSGNHVKKGNSEMPELADYSGPFNPNIGAGDFSKETIIAFLLEKCRLFVLMEGYYQDVIRTKMGDEAACDWACEVYRADKLPRAIMTGVRRVFNIQGDDVESFMKAMQCAESNGLQWGPNTPHLFQWEIDLKNRNDSVLTVKRCPALLYLEKEGKGYERLVCGKLEVMAFQTYASAFNPKIQARPLQIPPRKNRGENAIACQWEYTLEQE